MLKDITIGQYFPGNSFIHRMDPRFKIICTLLFIVTLFAGSSIWTLVIGGVFVVLMLALSRIPFGLIWKSVKPILPILVFTGLLNLVFVGDDNVLWEWKFIKITMGGIQ
ncbi:MAG: energy-coupling factor transporter transmembrane protein EcfT, partial [Oscillospiraceae bacterium]|nr:energy-coupling factor transporter transmembrane protein EcfT [Oscillospiraceae bacterium]